MAPTTRRAPQPESVGSLPTVIMLIIFVFSFLLFGSLFCFWIKKYNNNNFSCMVLPRENNSNIISIIIKFHQFDHPYS